MILTFLGSSSKKDNDLQPIKGGTVTEMEEEPEKGEDSQTGKASDTNTQVCWIQL